MEKFYFTFASGHPMLDHRFVEIEAETHEEARDIMNETFGLIWCWQYTEREWSELNVKNYAKLNVNEFWKE